MSQAKIENLLNSLSAKILPAKRRKPTDDGFHETTIQLKTPKLRKWPYYQLLYRLKKDGLVETAGNRDSLTFRATEIGKQWLEKFEAKAHLRAPEYTEKTEQGDRVTIISYDIPERLHLYRDWLRITLRALNLNKMHQSVWIGKTKLPPDFIADIIRFKLEDYIEIFEITKTGTLLHKL